MTFKKQISLLLVLITLNLSACKNGNTAGGQGIVNEKISVVEFDKKLGTSPGAQLIDVRTPGEYAGGHLKNAINIDLRSPDFEQRIGALDKHKPVFVYCLSGGRSGAAADKMADMGFQEVYNMDGGIMKWGAAGKPTESGAGAAPTSTGMSQADLDKLTATSHHVLVDYNASWCEPCKKMMPMLEALAEKKKGDMTLVKVDADVNKTLLQAKSISSIPYLELYEDGKLVWHHDGALEENELLAQTKL